MKKKFAVLGQSLKDHKTLYISSFAIGILTGLVQNDRAQNRRCAALEESLDNTNEVLSVIWNTYLPDPTLEK